LQKIRRIKMKTALDNSVNFLLQEMEDELERGSEEELKPIIHPEARCGCGRPLNCYSRGQRRWRDKHCVGCDVMWNNGKGGR
jgi:hypothetical protein